LICLVTRIIQPFKAIDSVLFFPPPEYPLPDFFLSYNRNDDPANCHYSRSIPPPPPPPPTVFSPCRPSPQTSSLKVFLSPTQTLQSQSRPLSLSFRGSRKFFFWNYVFHFTGDCSPFFSFFLSKLLPVFIRVRQPTISAEAQPHLLRPLFPPPIKPHLSLNRCSFWFRSRLWL